jgi:prevent-host-death family protein
MTRAAARNPARSKPRTTSTMSVAEARAQLAEAVRRAESGEEIVITRRGSAVAVLRPVADDTVRRERFRAWMRSLEEPLIRGRAAAPDSPSDPWSDVRDRSDVGRRSSLG